MVSVGRRPPTTANRHIQVDDLADLRALRDIDFDKVVFIIGNTDHHNLEKLCVPAGEPNAFDYHVLPLIQTLEQLKERRLKKFVHFSSILLYDEERITLPVSEDAPINPYKNRYTMSKYLGEELCRFYGNWVPIINIRMSNLYGPTPLRRYDLIHVLSRRLLKEGSARIWNDRPRRDFIYVEDAAEAILALLDSEATGTFNLGSGAMTAVREVIDILSDVSGCPIAVEGRPVDGPMEFECDLSRLREAIEWSPQTSLRDGVEKTFRMTAAWKKSGDLAPD